MGNKHPLAKSVNHVVQTTASVFAASILSLTGIMTCAILGSVFLNEKANAVIDEELYHLDMSTAQYVNINITPSPSGSIAIGASDVTVTSTTPGGYGLYLSGGNTLYRNGDTTITDADKKIISTTGTYNLPISLISNSTTPATWGYAIAGVGNFDESYDVANPSASAKFAAVPATNSEQVIQTKNETVTDETVTVYYGINANTNLTSGEYVSGEITYYSLADISSLIGGELTVSPAFITPNQENTVVITTSLNTAMDVGTVDATVGGYACTSKTITSTTPLTISCTLPNTIPQGHYDVEVNTSRFGKNYAAEKAIHVLYAMQNISEEFVATMTPEAQYQMYDLRDNKIYFVSKLADGNVWMTQNLDLEIPATGITLSPETTHIEEEKTITPAATWGTDPNEYYYHDGGDYYAAPSANNADNDTVSSLESLALDAEERHYSLGSYYSYTLAVTGDSISNDNYSYGYATHDICPKGWTLSNTGDYNQYSGNILLKKYNAVTWNSSTVVGSSDATMRQSPLYFTRGGQFNGTYTGLGVYGGVWSRYYTYNSRYVDGDYVYDKVGYLIGFDSEYVSPYYYKQFGANLRSDGFNIRCVAIAPRTYTLSYDANGGTLFNGPNYYDAHGSVWGENDTSAAVASTSTIAWRVGYKMIGYADSPDATEPQYHGGDVLDLTGDRTLYVIWEYEPIYQAYHDAGKQQTAEGYFKMQDMTEEICAAVPTPTGQYEDITSRLVDERDGKLYYVSKLMDGNCWMTQNLDFELLAEGTTLSPETTAVVSEKTITLADTLGTSNITYADGGDISPYTNNSINEANTYAASNMWHYHIGSYYSYAAATAGSGIDLIGQNAVESVCPKGWRLPIGSNYTDNKSYGHLLDVYEITQGANINSNIAQKLKWNPFYFQLGGLKNGDTVSYFNQTGFYWTASAYSAPHSFYMSFTNNNISARHSNERYSRASVRCVQGSPRKFTIHYNANGGENAPADTNSYILTDDTTLTKTLTISANIPTREGRTFVGWATTADAIAPEYGTNDPFVSAGEDTLYAVWSQFDEAYANAGKQMVNGYYVMQDMTEEICAAVATPTDAISPSTVLLDTRDQKKYFVSKLIDGNCWMTQNLDFALSTEGTTLYPESTAVLSEKTIVAAPEFASENDIIIYQDGEGDHYQQGTNYVDISENDRSLMRHYHTGSYYSYAAATAGSGIGLATLKNANESICPKGWRLPTSNNDADPYSFGQIINSGYYSFDNMVNAPMYMNYFGYYRPTGALANRGTLGYFWSATAPNNGKYAYDQSFSRNNNWISGSANTIERYYSLSVRCIVGNAKEYQINYDANGGMGAPDNYSSVELYDTYSVNLSTTTPTRENYIFLGWSESASATEATYQPGVSTLLTGNNPLNLYAVWKPEWFNLAYANAGKTKNADGYYSMQDMTPEICAAVPTPATAEDEVPISSLVDVRDGFVYFVAKLMDGKCWMTQNLYYQIHLAQYKTLSPLTTDVRVQKEIVTNNSWNNAYHNSEYSRGAFHYDGKGNLQSGVPAVGNTQRHYVDGTIYSYSTAVTGLTEADVNAGNTTDSLCPRGWRMPMGGSNGVTGSQEDSEMGVLFNNYGVIHNRALEEGETLTHTMSPLYLTQGGQRIANQFVNVGSEAVYWQNGVGTVTEDNGEGGTVDKIYASSVFISNDLNTLGRTVAYNGGYLRCVASADTPAIVTFTPDDEITGEFVGNDIATTMAVVPVGTTYTIDGDTITFSNGAVVKAQGKYRYGYSNTFVSWNVNGTSGTITSDTEFTANFNARLLFRGITTMQEMTPEICAEAWENDSIRPFDTRDNERYWITKLADGRCWMTEDLDFAIASADEGGTTLYPETSNVTEERNIGYTTTTANTNGYRRETYYDADSNIIRTINTNNGAGYGSYNAGSTAFDSLQWHYRLGAFYGYNIATAGTGNSLAWGSDTNATESICPKGWHLPTAHSDTQEVDNLISSNTFSAETGYAYQSPTYFYRSGYMASGQASVTDRGNYGNRWTANVDYNIYTYYGMGLDRNRTTVYNWNLGIRCIADAE